MGTWAYSSSSLMAWLPPVCPVALRGVPGSRSCCEHQVDGRERGAAVPEHQQPTAHVAATVLGRDQVSPQAATERGELGGRAVRSAQRVAMLAAQGRGDDLG